MGTNSQAKPPEFTPRKGNLFGALTVAEVSGFSSVFLFQAQFYFANDRGQDLNRWQLAFPNCCFLERFGRKTGRVLNWKT